MYIKNTLERMFTIAELENDAALADFIIYSGKDKERKWVDVCNVENADELSQVKSIRQRINSEVLGREYKFIAFTTQTESEGIWHIWELEVMNEEKAEKVYFAFLPFQGGYALGDID